MEPLPPRHTHPGVNSKPLLGLGALSVYARTRRHPQTRIIVEPLLWTKLQLELLQCTFSEPLHAPPTVMKLNYDDDSDRQRAFAYHMFGSRGYGNRATAVQCLISGPEVPLQYFYDNVLLPCSFFCLRDKCEGTNKPTPIVAYVDHDKIVYLRRKKFSRMYGIEDPGIRLARIRLKSYNFTEPLQDPYLVAIMIAFAQKQRRALRPAVKEQVSGVCPKLLRTSGNTDVIHLYSTNMSFTFLSMFDDPAVPPPTPQSLSIQITAIPCKPLNTLREHT
ncbi:hypothetical protein CIB48_g12311 [Xylaria polymorpha]|nr:hypothetical protein CIB48_g12311 [Xylaria polymorpha]